MIGTRRAANRRSTPAKAAISPGFLFPSLWSLMADRRAKRVTTRIAPHRRAAITGLFVRVSIGSTLSTVDSWVTVWHGVCGPLPSRVASTLSTVDSCPGSLSLPLLGLGKVRALL
jgi:hypothetical protein